jgi:plastocyanin
MTDGDSNEGIPSVDTNNAYDVIKLENFDYHLNYDSEEVLTSFTSNNGQWTWTLMSDSFGDLTHIRVMNPYVPFTIAMIWELYDMRKKDPETEEKGKLTDVVLLGIDGNPLLSGLTITPERVSTDPGNTVQYVAEITLQDGSHITVTDDSEWSIYLGPDNMPISKGKVSNAQTGTWTIIASYGGKEAQAILEVVPVTLELDPPSKEIVAGERVQYTLYTVRNGIRTRIAWDAVTWKIIADNGADPLPNISNGLVTNTTHPGGRYTISAIYNGNTANGTLTIIKPTLLIDPASVEINEGDTVQFSALLRNGPGLTTVTNSCTWSISPSGPTISNGTNKGKVTNTSNAQGTYTIKATYSSLSLTATATLKIRDAQFWIEPPTKNVDASQTASYKAYYRDSAGNTTDVSDSATWTIESPCTINKGLATAGSTPGTFGISATYLGKNSSATLVVVAPKLEIRPDSQTIKIGESATYRAYFTNNSGEIDVTDSVIWSINSTTFIMSKGYVHNCNTPGTYELKAVYNTGGNSYNDTASLVVQDINFRVDPASQTVDLGTTATVRAYSDGVDVTALSTWTRNGNPVSNFDGHVLVNEAGPITMVATYKGKTAQGVINVRQRQLVIVPGSYAINLGETRTFKAYLRASGVSDIDVTNSCDWTIGAPLTITQSGQIGNTNQVGTYPVTATYRPVPSLTANATVIISEYTFPVHDTNITLQVRDNSDLDGDCITIWVNGTKKLDNYKLTAEWKDIPCTFIAGSNSIKLGATANGIDWYYNPSYGPMYGAGQVTAAVRGVKTGTSTVVIPETLLYIDAPPRGEERISLDPNSYFKIWAVDVT